MLPYLNSFEIPGTRTQFGNSGDTYAIQLGAGQPPCPLIISIQFITLSQRVKHNQLTRFTVEKG